ncbi:ExbD/TolR family protein [Psychromonas ossibalaenae]|uniref:ExbD/TolR family protein n=1 Tax=Psychromonas ossibalaenae TaxID=444922 RepID=UPI000364EF37|nr:biopolymer transporter ExbD [Psychromonas ossibalaenae]
MKLHKRRFLQPARVELLPLIDVIFLLLILFIFVMLTMTVQSSIKIVLPQVAVSELQTKEMLTISINAENQIFVNEQPSSTQDFLTQVSALQHKKTLPILIRGDQKADLGIALSILNKLRSTGFEHVTFAAEKDN